MKKFIFIVASLFPLTVLFAQVKTIKISKEKFVSATFPGGNDSLESYFKRTVADIVKYQQNAPEEIKFKSWIDIAANGKITKVSLLNGSAFPYIDSLFINAVIKMPDWKPATNELGNKTTDKQLLPLNIKIDSDKL